MAARKQTETPKKPLRARVLEDIEKSGFGSEMRAVQCIAAEQWNVTTSYAYNDLDEDKTREVDAVAHVSTEEKHSDGRTVRVFYQLVAEVKKTEAPWVVLRGRTGVPLLDAWTNLIIHTNFDCDFERITTTIHDHSLLKKVGWLGSGIHQSFKDPSAPSRWYAAFVAVSKAAEYSLLHNSPDDKRPKRKGSYFLSPYLFFSKPLVILDGPLFSAHIEDDGTVSLAEIDCACFEFSYRTKAYTRSHYSVDLIRLPYLKDYLRIAYKRCADLHKVVFSTLKPAEPESDANATG